MTGSNHAELEADALRQAREFFGDAVPLAVSDDYVALPGTGTGAKWCADIYVTREREPLAQSAAAEQVRRQVQRSLRRLRERYGRECS